MRLLFDVHMALDLLQPLQQAGLDCRHVSKVDLRKAPDVAIFDHAQRHEALVVTRDWRDYVGIARGRWSAALPIALVVMAYNYSAAVEARALQQFHDLHPQIICDVAAKIKVSAYVVIDPSEQKIKLHSASEAKIERGKVVAHGNPHASYPITVGALPSWRRLVMAR